MKPTDRLVLPLFLLASIITILIFLLSSTLQKYNIDSSVLLAANAILFVISIFSFFIQKKGLQNKNPHAFVRSVMTGMMSKMIICVVAVFLYVYLSGNGFNKRAIFIALFLYLIYLAVEVSVLMKMNKNKKADG